MTSTNDKLPDLAKPTSFSGNRTDTKCFLAQCNLYMKARAKNFDNDYAKIAFVLSLMKGGLAEQWAMDYTDVLATTLVTTYADFEKALKAVFEKLNSERNMIDTNMQPPMTTSSRTIPQRSPITMEGGRSSTPIATSHGTLNALSLPIVIPMDIDKSAFRKLDPQERADLQKKGGCFYCRKPEHFAWQCPKRNQHSKGNTKKPFRNRTTELAEEAEEEPSCTDQFRDLMQEATSEDLNSIYMLIEEEGLPLLNF
ncbi:hypothetical protein EW146_g9250 [Bondarzewia mesenterica]|uniref:CCHC-type domain-containing protein n=1 Tax=Bondarzewia mesenterica TaxID=1095465 RepID=A0A4S4L844_9AGAM|nr:hypothetical protein EW146_g9250 [Bondarzewia mesenterica]